MRIAVDLDDDVLVAAREISHRRGISMGQALSDLARQALSSRAQTATRNGVPLIPIQPGAGIVTRDLVRRLLDEEL